MAFSLLKKKGSLKISKKSFTLFFYYFLLEHWVKMKMIKTNSEEGRNLGGNLPGELKIVVYPSD